MHSYSKFEWSVQIVGFVFGSTTEVSNVHVNLHCYQCRYWWWGVIEDNGVAKLQSNPLFKKLKTWMHNGTIWFWIHLQTNLTNYISVTGHGEQRGVPGPAIQVQKYQAIWDCSKPEAHSEAQFWTIPTSTYDIIGFAYDIKASSHYRKWLTRSIFKSKIMMHYSIAYIAKGLMKNCIKTSSFFWIKDVVPTGMNVCCIFSTHLFPVQKKLQGPGRVQTYSGTLASQ